LLSTNVLTAHNDLMRTGDNLTETALTPANVNVNTFGQLFSYPVDGWVYAQPLYMANLTLVDGSVHNVVFVATEHNSVFAFDANNPDPTMGGGLLWQTSFNNPANGITAVPAADMQSDGFGPEEGITATPVIDPNSNLLYVAYRTKEVRADEAHFVQTIASLDITSGNIVASTVIGDTMGAIGGTTFTNVTAVQVPGTGDGSDGSMVSFNALTQHERAGLLLYNGTVYTTWASEGDYSPYHGWVIAFDPASLQMTNVLCTTPNDGDGGIWMSAGAPAVDATGSIYLATGNGAYHPERGSIGESALKFSGDGSLTLLDSFTPSNWQELDLGDLDFGSTGIILLPDQPGAHQHLLVEAGKSGMLTLLDRDNLGGFHDTDQAVQELSSPGAYFCTPAYFDAGSGGRFLYLGQTNHTLKAYRLNNGLLPTTPTSQTADSFGYPGTTASISANGTANGIVWVIQQNPDIAVLRAYDPLDLSHELYDSNQEPTGRDQMDYGIHFTAPTVADGQVFAATYDSLFVFGLLGPGGSPHVRGGKQLNRSPAGGLSPELYNGTSAAFGQHLLGVAGPITSPLPEGSLPVRSGLLDVPPEGLSGQARKALPATPAVASSGQSAHFLRLEDVVSLQAADLLFQMSEQTR
jgi:hypothetical protein